MKNRYLVANPMGVFMIRCDSMEEVNVFVKAHVKKCEDAYRFLTGNQLSYHAYQVRDLTEIPTYEELYK